MGGTTAYNHQFGTLFNLDVTTPDQAIHVSRYDIQI